MKKKSALFALILALAMAIAAVPAFAEGELTTTAAPVSAPLTTAAPTDLAGVASAPAGGLDIIQTTPDDGAKGKNPQNMAVKLKFNDTMVADGKYAADPSLFKITDAEGKDIPFEITFNEMKNPDELWLVISETLQPNMEYKFTAAAGVASVNGYATETETVVNFKTRNTKTDSYISIVMMVGMMVIMFLVSSKARKNAQENKDAESGRSAEGSASVNPYKIAKEKGISLEQAKQIAERNKAKVSKKQARLDEKKAKQDAALQAKIAEIKDEVLAKMEAERKAGNYRVKRSGSMLEKGYKIPKAIIRRQKAIRAKANKKK